MVASSAQTGEWIAPAEVRSRFGWMQRLTRQWIVRALLAVVAWSAVGWLFALPNDTSENAHTHLLASLAEWWPWVVLSPLILAFDRWLPYSGKQIKQRVVAHFLGSFLFTAIYLYVCFTIRALLGIEPWSSLNPSHMLTKGMGGWFMWSWVICWVVVGVQQAYRYYQRYMSSELRLERLEHSFAEARLNSLRMQLDPHFLFNALNTISSHVERDPKLTRRMIEHLGDLLRLSLDSKDKQEVPLFEEMAFLEHYLAIQKIRFGDQLNVSMQIEPAVRNASVPSLFLQPLVENAIRHGISRRASGGSITVKAVGVDDRLEIRVLDDGVGLPSGWSMEASAGLGLSITRERIAGLHPNGASRFTLRNREKGGTVVEISLPLRLVGGEFNGGARV